MFFFFWPFGFLPLKKFCLVQKPTSLLHHWFWEEFSFLSSLYILFTSRLMYNK
jgi:hypothetical protein